jgi:hypothetical protein
MEHEFAAQLAKSERTYSIAPAGCGKTTAVARAVAQSDEGRQLILTHTHAGVDALRKHLRAAGVPPRCYEVATLAGWALRLAVAYPQISGLTDPLPQEHSAWTQVYSAASRFMQSSLAKLILSASYAGVYVDEYQDCTCRQHNLVMALAEMLPCRILGDPLQGIFGFNKDDTLVDWDDDVVNNFNALPGPCTPWRWYGRNEALGKWLTQVRELLLGGQSVDLRGSAARWVPSPQRYQMQAEWQTCMEMAQKGKGSVVAIHKWPNNCYATASRLQGAYTCMETVECGDLLEWAYQLETSAGYVRAASLIEFASRCMTKVGTALKPVRTALASERLPSKGQIQKFPVIVEALLNVAQTPELVPIVAAMGHLVSIPGRCLYRKELWEEMRRAILLYSEGGFGSLQEAAWHLRDRARQYGRACAFRTVSRTLLVKGLEFDNVILLSVDKMDRRDLYVALTRGSRTLTVLSEQPIMRGL